MNTLTTDEIRSKIKAAHGKIFSVEFTKKNGEFRKMLCRTGVKKYTNGGELKFDPVSKGLVSVYDLQKKGYRFIPVGRVHKIKIEGEEHEVS